MNARLWSRKEGGVAATRDAWLNLVQEDPLEPDLPIVDAHHHIWPTAPVDGYEPWDIGEVRLYKARSGHNIVATIFSESHACYRTAGPAHLAAAGETDYVALIAEEADREGPPMAGLCRGIVGNADMMLGAAAVDELLAAHAAAAPARFRGIRYITASDSDMNIPARFMAKPGVMRDPDFLAAFERLAARDLVFDAFLPHPQLSEVAALARAFPETRIVINHTGGPMAIGRYACTAAARFEEWRDGLAACAAYPHVRLKLGGLQMWFTGLGWSDLSRPPTSADIAESQAGHILTAIEIFGPDRCMFESNFPVDMIHVGGTVLWNAFKRITAGLDRAARADLFAGTAARAYRIEI